ncbi:MAG: methyltransferase domain-containing protein [Deltaproteobacteria bacterium]|nr:methyltransferase domain-containing protein [Deltaproteobacteria bacterium]
MDAGGSSKHFDAIHDEYAFFQQHSTEAEQDLRAHLPYLTSLAQSGPSIRLLDFGCGDGEFLGRLLAATEVPPPRLFLSLVEPDAGYLSQARSRIRVFTTHPVSAWPSLPPETPPRFDLILVNHVFYYVTDLVGTLKRLLEARAPEGRLLVSLAGRDNILSRIIDRSFASIREPAPYHFAEDLEKALASLRQPFRRRLLPYTMDFPDLESNRRMTARFLLGEHLSRMDWPHIMKLFDPYVKNGRVVIDTNHYHFVIAAAS